MAAGFAEVVKTALIAGGGLWERVRSMGLVQDLEPDELNRLVFDCARTKIEVVASDERDSGRRAVLNLGHTVAHAIETVTALRPLPPRRGGRAGAARRAAALGGRRAARRGRRRCSERPGLPVTLDAGIHAADVAEATARDKKASAAGVGLRPAGAPRRAALGRAGRGG